MSLEKKLKDSMFVIGTETSSCWVIRLTRVDEELGKVAQKIPCEIQKICKSWFYAKKSSELKLQVLIDMLSVAMKGLLVEPSKETKKDE